MPPGAQTSLEDRFLQFYLESIEKLEECWLGPDGLKEKTFGRQLLFLISLLPDLEKQKELREKWQEASKQQDNDESIMMILLLAIISWGIVWAECMSVTRNVYLSAGITSGVALCMLYWLSRSK